jgi:hypothetical protein
MRGLPRLSAARSTGPRGATVLEAVLFVWDVLKVGEAAERRGRSSDPALKVRIEKSGQENKERLI